MNPVDLVMIDTSADEWFDLDFDHYQRQVVYGYTRITPEAGLQIFMPDTETIAHQDSKIGLQWPKDQNVLAPAQISPSNR